MREWYRAAVDCTPTPARVALATMTVERGELYRNVPPPGDPIPVREIPFLVDDYIPGYEDTAWAVRRLRLNRMGSPPRMQAKHLRQWLIAVTRDKSPDATNWMKVVAIVQAAFRGGTLAKECMCQTVVFIPKGKGYFRGIGHIEVL